MLIHSQTQRSILQQISACCRVYGFYSLSGNCHKYIFARIRHSYVNIFDSNWRAADGPLLISCGTLELTEPGALWVHRLHMLMCCLSIFLIACSMIYGSPKVLSAASAWIPLLYDTIVLLLTLYVTVPSIRRSEKGFIVRTILTDGLKYYAVICVVTMVLTIMIAGAPPGLKNITAQLQLLWVNEGYPIRLSTKLTIQILLSDSLQRLYIGSR